MARGGVEVHSDVFPVSPVVPPVCRSVLGAAAWVSLEVPPRENHTVAYRGFVEAPGPGSVDCNRTPEALRTRPSSRPLLQTLVWGPSYPRRGCEMPLVLLRIAVAVPKPLQFHAPLGTPVVASKAQGFRLVCENLE